MFRFRGGRDCGTFFGATSDFYEKVEEKSGAVKAEPNPECCPPDSWGPIWGNQTEDCRAALRKEAIMKIGKRFPKTRSRFSCKHKLAAQY